jgi:TonB-dependent receptor
MSPQNTNRKLLSLAVAGACAAWTGHAGAQETSTGSSAAAADDKQPQQVVVTGFRSSLEKALLLKQQAIGIRDSIVAEDIGKFPEQNVADALVRLPGVEVIKDGASNEGQRIQMRGLGSEYTVTTFNGAPVRATSAGNIGGASRDFNYDIFASELFGRVDVYKTPLAELEEGGVAGAVDMQTPHPFDYKGRVIRYQTAVMQNSRSGLKSPRGFVLFSNTWGNWGFLAGVTRSRAKNANAGFDSTGTYNSTNQRLNSGSFNYAYNLTDPTANYSGVTLDQLRDANLPRFFRVTTGQNLRDRLGFNTALQYKAATWDVSWDTLYSKLQDDNKNNYINFPIRDSTAANALIPRGVTVDANNNLQGSLANVQHSSNSLTSKSETDFRYHNLSGRWRVTPSLRLSGQAGVNRSVAWRSDATLSADSGTAALDTRNVITFSTTDDAIFPQLKTDRNLLDPTMYRTFGYTGSYRTETDRQQVLKGNLEYDYRVWDVKARFKTGLSRVKSTKEALSYTATNLLNGLSLPSGKLFGDATATAAEKAAFAQQFLVPNDLKYVSIPNNPPTDFMVFDKSFVYGKLDALNANRASALNKGGSFTAVETVTAAYVQSDLEKEVFGRVLRVNAGVRYARTDTGIDNYVQVQGAYQPAHQEGSYHNVMPSLSLAYDLTDSLVWRASAGKTITRSSISLIARSYAVPGAGDLIVNAGNPNLKPQQSNSLDTALEWYFEKGSVLALSAFQKKIKDRPVSGFEFVPFNTLGLPKELFTANIQNQLTLDPATPVQINRWRNADAFKVRGLELAYQQSYRKLPYPFNNLGSIVSVTRIDTAGFKAVYQGQSYELPIIPKQTYALTAFYEEGPLALRTSYNHKSAFANQNAPQINPLGYQRWFNARGYLDASASYKINSMLELRLDGSNLTNQRTYETLRHFYGKYGDENSRIASANLAGRNYTLSLRGSF